ncbi:MAG TPA: hypothetical protein VNO30_24525 [Kofleriaceae bacterium]|nr:hypothetical protein [Kofleriaceae bacterium]
MSRSLYITSVLSSALVAAVALLAPACSTSDAAGPAPAAPAQTQAQAQPASSGTGNAKDVCVAVFTHNRTCTAQYIPALVDLRAKYDVPAGIAAEVAAHRDQVIAQANEEWAVDSTAQAIDATCTKITANAGPKDHSDMAGIQQCLTIQDCAAYTACVMPYFEKRFAK